MSSDGFTLGTTADGKPLVVDPGDLTTHGVIVGMTGSGKTGLAIVLLEEALLAGTPVLVLDPKGDMGNLLLTFPDLAPESFRPWVSESGGRLSAMRFEDLPLVTDEAEMRRVHRTDGLYFVVRGGKAHYEMTCQHIEDLVEAGKIVGNPRWRIATYNESRAVGIPWCQTCCE